MTETVSIPLVNLTPDLPAPEHAYAGDAGVDLHAACDVELAPFERRLVPSGIAIALPAGFAGLVMPRSGLAAKHGISIVNAPGLIDSNYRGEIKVCLINLDPKETFTAKRGDRIAQLMVVRVPEVSFEACDELEGSERGAAGFGSSGISG